MSRTRRATPRPAPARTDTAPDFRLGLIAALAAAVLVHAGSLSAPFFADDWLFLDQVRMRTLLGALTSADPLGNFFRPLGRQLWFWLLAHASGNAAWVFHAANLALWVAAVALLARLGRRLAGPATGVLAAALFAVHYAADVPVLWASGSQELLSLVLALFALDRHAAGRRLAAAALLFAALLAKEVVVLAPLAALALDREGGTIPARLKRAWPLFAAVAVWFALAFSAMLSRGAPAAGMTLTPLGPLAVPLLLARVSLGLEWRTGGLPFAPPSLPAAGVLVALALAGFAAHRGAPARRGEAETDVRSGALTWALVGALPVAAVAPVWSAYYFLFAVAGVSLALASALVRARASRTVVVAVVLAWGFASAQARALSEFATAPGLATGQSHVNRFYLERGMSVVSRSIAGMRRDLPVPERGTTFFFAGLPSFASVQVADGPLVRGVYRDTTLRGYYLSQLTRERLGRGPVRVFFYHGDTGELRDHSGEKDVFMSAALGQLLNGRYEAALAALEAGRRNGDTPGWSNYLRGLAHLALESRDSAAVAFAAAGFGSGGNGDAAVRRAAARLGVRDTFGAVTEIRDGLRADVFHPGLHALLADLELARPEAVREGRIESFAAMLLQPEAALTWRRWAGTLAAENRQREAVAALERYFAMDPGARTRDPQAVELLALLKRMLPGGDIAQREMQREQR